MRIIIITALFVALSFNSQAQSLSDLFKSLTSSSSSTTTTETTTSEPTTIPQLSKASLLGLWSFSKLAVGLAEGSSLQNMFGKAVISQVENLVNSLSASNGIKEGMFSMTIFNDDILSVEFENGAKANSPYTLNTEQSSLMVDIGTLNNIEIGALVATIAITSESDITLLFDSKDLFAIADQIPSIVENSQYQMVKSTVSSLDGIMLGFKLKKI
ncbi:MAG: DUF4923 family protein [Rikenellaceae bacterium]